MRLAVLVAALGGCKQEVECVPSDFQGFLTLTIDGEDIGPSDSLNLPIVWSVCDKQAGTAIMTQTTQTFTPPAGDVHGNVEGGTWTPAFSDPIDCIGSVDVTIPENGDAEDDLVLFCD